ncbi:MAG: hypothetical protein ACE5FY_04195 [Nitrospiria bacterium]
MQQSFSKRLSAQVRPERYCLSVFVLPEEGCFSGSVQIELNLNRSVTSFSLHALELKINRADIQADGIDSLTALITVIPSDEMLSLSFQKPLKKGNGPFP